jgi:hypothetical protein
MAQSLLPSHCEFFFLLVYSHSSLFAPFAWNAILVVAQPYIIIFFHPTIKAEHQPQTRRTAHLHQSFFLPPKPQPASTRSEMSSSGVSCDHRSHCNLARTVDLSWMISAD